jgi:hypothetical protein
MSKIILISCVSKKEKSPTKAKDLYISPLFKYNLKYATLLKPDKIFILSAKYGLLRLDQTIEPYNLTLNTMKNKEILEWSEKVYSQLIKETNITNDSFIFLAGKKYRQHLIPKINNYSIPLEGLSIGKQLKFLKEKTNE